LNKFDPERLRLSIEPYAEGYLAICGNTYDQSYGETKTEALLNLCVILANLSYYRLFDGYILTNSDVSSL